VRQVAIVIVNWNSGSQVRDCVDSIILHRNQLRVSTIVVDNASTDGSADLVEGLRNVELIRAGSNLGFARACNLGASSVKDAEYLLFLNPDAMLEAGALQRAVDFMDSASSAGIGICGVALQENSGHVARSCARFPSPWRLAVVASGLDRVFPSLGTTMREWNHAQSRRVDQVIGAFFLVRRALFDALNGFDERFFVYFEEVDFAFRASRLGMGTMFLSDIKAFHAGGGTSKQVKARRLFYSLRSRVLYARKHFSTVGYLLVVLTAVGVEPLARSVNHLIRGQLAGVVETLTAYRMLLNWAIGVEK
jgi:GT2 family glycosyltransferase